MPETRPSPPVPNVSPTNRQRHDSVGLLAGVPAEIHARVAGPRGHAVPAAYPRALRVEPKNHSKHDTPGGYGITPCATNYDLVHVADGRSNSCRAARRRVSRRAGLVG
jgi:hypothetical protein